ncbi:MAG: DegT/DnrJ/EryC1/StrS family aminotransferase [Cellvibrionaceae bacterium]
MQENDVCHVDRENNHRLALLGGSKTIPYNFEPYQSIGDEECKAVNDVMATGVLSQFLGCWHKDFYGGPKVLEFEQACKTFFNVKHAITVNSWTSGLTAALGAIDLEPGDEVIVSPWTMCASATAILQWNAIPVFADIDPRTYTIDPVSIENNINEKTKAILAVDIFGYSADMDTLMSIAKKYNLKVISDTAQAPGAMYKGKHAGTIADIGGYSLNYHKHINTGEGGILVTNDDELAERMRLIRNHAEAVVGPKGETKLNNMVGSNFRLGEIECAIGIEQLKKLPKIIDRRQYLSNKLLAGLSCLKGLQLPFIGEDCSHVFYMFPMQVDPAVIGCSRQAIAEALMAEGVPVSMEYQNLHLLPMYQQKIAYGSKGFPWTADFSRQNIDYTKGICPVAEGLNDERYLGFLICLYDLSEKDIDLIITAFKKVWDNLTLLTQA